MDNNRADYYDLVRQLVEGDHEAYARRCSELDQKGWEGLGLVVGAAFYQAVEQRFGDSLDPSEVIRFVADFRADITDTGFEVDPRIAENLIRAAITGDTEQVRDLDPSVVVEAEMLMLWKFLGHLSGAELTLFFEEADSLVVEWSK